MGCRARAIERGNCTLKILVGVDGSPCSAAAVAEVAARPWPAGSEVIVLAVAHSHIPQIPDPFFIMYAAHEESLEEEQRSARNCAGDAARRIEANPVIRRVTTEILKGPPGSVIVKEAERLHADLVVLGCHGYGIVQRFLRGSVSQAVFLHAPCSVEVVRSHDRTAA